MACATPYMVKLEKSIHKRNSFLIDANTTGNSYVPVRCGRCPDCLKRRVNEWVFRLLQEDKVSLTSHFITLTYDNDHVPLSKKGFMTLSPMECRIMKNGKKSKTPSNDLTLFWKKLRRRLGTTAKLKYYAVGEYGSTNQRPHYHAIVFNVDDPNAYYDSWVDEEGNPMGIVDVGTVSGNSIAYCAQYIQKGTKVPMFAGDDRLKERATMSNGLGEYYTLDPSVVKYHKDDINRNYCVLEGGVKVPMPRYYREKIYTVKERNIQNMVAMLKSLEQEDLDMQSHYKKHGFYPDPILMKRLKDIAKKNRFDSMNNLKPRKL